MRLCNTLSTLTLTVCDFICRRVIKTPAYLCREIRTSQSPVLTVAGDTEGPSWGAVGKPSKGADPNGPYPFLYPH